MPEKSAVQQAIMTIFKKEKKLKDLAAIKPL